VEPGGHGNCTPVPDRSFVPLIFSEVLAKLRLRGVTFT